MEDYDMVEGEEEGEWMWWYELKEAIAGADQIHVNEEDFGMVSDILDVKLDDDGFIVDTETDEFVEPRVPTEVDGSWEFVPIKDMAHQNPEPQSYVPDSVGDRMERDKSTPEKLHVSDLYGVDKYAGDPVFLYNDFYSGIMMDASEWTPMFRVRPLYEWECNLCGHDYTNREDDSGGTVPSCPNCGKRQDRSLVAVIGMWEVKFIRANKKAKKLKRALGENG